MTEDDFRSMWNEDDKQENWVAVGCVALALTTVVFWFIAFLVISSLF
jgi:hypothetical protein